MGMTCDDTQTLLDHAHQKSDVTGRHYRLHDGTHLRWPLMAKWTAAIEPMIALALAEAPLFGNADWVRERIAADRFGEDDDISIAAE